MPRYSQEKNKGQKLKIIGRFGLKMNEKQADIEWKKKKSVVDYARQKEKQECT